MEKVEQYIRKNTNQFSNEDGFDYVPWLTPDQAKKAVEIAREEIYEWLEKNIYMYNGECESDRTAIIEDLKQAMKDE